MAELKAEKISFWEFISENKDYSMQIASKLNGTTYY